MGTLTPSRTTPRRPKRVATAGLLAVETLSQHWRSPVLHWLTVVGVAVAVTVTVVGFTALGAGVATARSGRARAAMANVNFMMRIVGGGLEKVLKAVFSLDESEGVNCLVDLKNTEWVGDSFYRFLDVISEM